MQDGVVHAELHDIHDLAVDLDIAWLRHRLRDEYFKDGGEGDGYAPVDAFLEAIDDGDVNDAAIGQPVRGVLRRQLAQVICDLELVHLVARERGRVGDAR